MSNKDDLPEDILAAIKCQLQQTNALHACISIFPALLDIASTYLHRQIDDGITMLLQFAYQNTESNVENSNKDDSNCMYTSNSKTRESTNNEESAIESSDDNDS